MTLAARSTALPRAALLLWGALILALAGLHAGPLLGGASLEADDFLSLVLLGALGLFGPFAVSRLRHRDRSCLQSRLEGAFDRFETGILSLDGKGRVNYVNPALLQTMAARAKDLLGRCPTQFLPTDAAAVFVRERARRAEGIYEPYRLRATRSDGEDVWLQIVPAPLLGETGEALATLVIVQDVTDEARAAGLREELEGQLRRVQRLDALGTLAGGIAHDFNDIFFTILGHVEMAEESVGDSPARFDLAQISRAGERGYELVRQLLTFARSSDRERAPMNIGPLVKQSAKLLESSVPVGIHIEAEVPPELPFTETYPAAVHQVLVNLATNAIRAVGQQGRIAIRLEAAVPTSDERSTHSLLDEQTWVVLRVQDDGCGIPSESRHRIFEPFFTTREVGAGRGMGLSVVHGIVEEHGGAILVDSEPGEGSTFSVFLPVCQAPARHERNEVRDAERASARILLVDDEVTLVRLMSSMLESAGHHVTAFVNPRDALTAFFDSPSNFDVVITDQSMPVVSGDALIASIRAAGHDLPVILATGSLPQLTPERLEELGVSVSISKPTTLRELREAVDDALDAARRARVPTGGVR